MLVGQICYVCFSYELQICVMFLYCLLYCRMNIYYLLCYINSNILLFFTFSVLVANPKKTTLHGGQSRSWSADFFSYFPFPVPVPAFCFGLATWVQQSHLASPLPSSVSGANLVLTHRLLSSLPLSEVVRQFWCHDRWYERSDLWIELTVHRQRHRLCR